MSTKAKTNAHSPKKPSSPKKPAKAVESRAKPAPEKSPIEAPPAAMSVDDKDQKVAELQTAIDDLLVPVPQPYPKWVVIDGVSQIVESLEEEERKTNAAALRKGTS